MRKVLVGADSNGIECIWFRKTFLFKDMQKVCTKIQDKLEESGIDSKVNISVEDSVIVLDIEVQDEYLEKIGTLEYMCEEETESEYYQLNRIYTNVASDEYTEEEWQQYSETLNKLVQEAL